MPSLPQGSVAVATLAATVAASAASALLALALLRLSALWGHSATRPAAIGQGLAGVAVSALCLATNTRQALPLPPAAGAWYFGGCLALGTLAALAAFAVSRILGLRTTGGAVFARSRSPSPPRLRLPSLGGDSHALTPAARARALGAFSAGHAASALGSPPPMAQSLSAGSSVVEAVDLLVDQTINATMGLAGTPSSPPAPALEALRLRAQRRPISRVSVDDLLSPLLRRPGGAGRLVVGGDSEHVLASSLQGPRSAGQGAGAGHPRHGRAYSGLELPWAEGDARKPPMRPRIAGRCRPGSDPEGASERSSATERSPSHPSVVSFKVPSPADMYAARRLHALVRGVNGAPPGQDAEGERSRLPTVAEAPGGAPQCAPESSGNSAAAGDAARLAADAARQAETLPALLGRGNGVTEAFSRGPAAPSSPWAAAAGVPLSLSEGPSSGGATGCAWEQRHGTAVARGWAEEDLDAARAEILQILVQPWQHGSISGVRHVLWDEGLAAFLGSAVTGAVFPGVVGDIEPASWAPWVSPEAFSPLLFLAFHLGDALAHLTPWATDRVVRRVAVPHLVGFSLLR